jgi:hypothetical protein
MVILSSGKHAICHFDRAGPGLRVVVAYGLTGLYDSWELRELRDACSVTGVRMSGFRYGVRDSRGACADWRKDGGGYSADGLE